MAKPRIASACGPRHWRLHHVRRTDHSSTDPKAQELLAAKARRVRLARQRVIAATLATFVLAWGIVAFEGSMGATTVASTSTPTTTTDTTTDSGASTATAPNDDATAPLTTSQS